MTTKSITEKKYLQFVSEIKGQILSARLRAIHHINKELIQLYWNIGKTIVERQKENGWGKSVVEELAKDLQQEFPNLYGFSARNLWDMRRFYEAYKNHEFLRQAVAEIPWGHNLLILNKISDIKEREYYLLATAQMGWSRNVLLNQIKADAYKYHKLLPKTNNFSKTLPMHLAEQADESMKSVYNLDFLGITNQVMERELENRLLENLKKFLLELGYGFSFMGSQYRLTLNGNEYFVDMLFYNRLLKALVAIELKAGKFLPEYAGKMDFYLTLLDEQTKLREENHSIGIILCAEKDHVVVEYALRNTRNPINVAEYTLTTKLPKILQGKLPDAKMFKDKIVKDLRNHKQ